MIKKKINLAIVLSVVMVWTSSVVSMATDYTEEMIVQQAIEMNDNTDWSSYNFTVITLEDNKRNLDLGTKVIQGESIEDGITTLTTIIPYKILEDGEMVNSFEYAECQGRTVAQPEFLFVDTTVKVNVYYNEITSLETGLTYYRHLGADVMWTSTNTTASVSKLHLNYDSVGDLCDENYNYIEYSYAISTVIDKTNPVKNECYAQSNMMSSDRWLRCRNYDEHGGLVHIELDYTVNGNYYNHADSWYVYR